jgi:hypothetical protein
VTTTSPTRASSGAGAGHGIGGVGVSAVAVESGVTPEFSNGVWVQPDTDTKQTAMTHKLERHRDKRTSAEWG